jgi:serine/threonine protein phosphatase 1
MSAGLQDADPAPPAPGFRGQPPPHPGSTNDRLIYALGDIHGCYDLLRRMLAEIVRDSADAARGRRPLLVFCGDYVDRGPDSARVVQALVWLQRRGDFELRLLKGNHEQGLLAFLDHPDRAADWLSYGGAETLASYGVEAPGPDARPDDFQRARDQLMDRLPASHLQLLGDLELMVQAGDYAFAHAGVRPGTALEEQVEADLLWIRRGFLDAPGPFGKVIVHGHTWLSDQPHFTPHRIGLDTGAYATGVLTGVRLDESAMQILQVRDR